MALKLSLGGRKPVTILLVTRDQLVRADFSSRGEKRGIWNCPRPMGEELPALIDAALRLERRRPKNVWILVSELWTQILPLHASSTNGLKDAELARALTFEAEALSGLSAFDSEAAFVPRGADGAQRMFWLVQLPRWQRDQLEEAVRSAGGTLAGIAHPAGLPASLQTVETKRWSRVELWSHAVVGIEGQGDDITRLHIINTDPRSGAWFDELNAWFTTGLADVQEYVVEDVAMADEVKGIPVGAALMLDNDPALETFLTGWAKSVTHAKPAVPHVRPAPKPLSRQQRQSVAFALAAVVAGVAYVDHRFVEDELRTLQSSTAVLREKVTRLDGIKKQSTEAAKNIDKKRKELDTVRQDYTLAEKIIEKHTGRYARLLALLSENCPDDLMIQAIKDEGAIITIAGRALGPHSANEFATDLVSELRDIGWVVKPARKTIGPMLVSDGEPWLFNLELEDLPLDSKDAKVTDEPFFRERQRRDDEDGEPIQRKPKFRFTGDGVIGGEES